MSQPNHLVHPVTEEFMLFDAHGRAKCRVCGARWHRDHTGIRLAE